MANNFVEIFGERDELGPENLKYLDALHAGADAFRRSFSIFTSHDFETKNGWKKELEKDDFAVHSMNIKEGKLFNVQYELPVSLEKQVEEDWNGVENSVNWDDDTDFADRSVILTDNVDIVHYGTKAIFFVSARDYVVIRIRRKVNGVAYTSAYSIDDKLPADSYPSDGRVRGVMHIMSARFRHHPTKPDHTLLDVMTCIDLKGFLPKSLINSQIPNHLYKGSQKHKKYVLTLK